MIPPLTDIHVSICISSAISATPPIFLFIVLPQLSSAVSQIAF